jgi:hypothetical protein
MLASIWETMSFFMFLPARAQKSLRYLTHIGASTIGSHAV